MNLIILSDLHISEHQIFTNSETGDNPSLAIISSVFDQVKEYADKFSVGHIIHTGDLFDTRNRVPIKLIRFAQEQLQKLFASQVFLLRGTPFHDGEGDNYSGLVMDPLENVRVYDSPSLYETDLTPAMFFLPAGRKDDLLAQIKEWSGDKVYQKKKNRIIFGHAPLAGAKTLSYESPADESLSCKDLKFWDFGFFGHYHSPVEVWKNFFQVGSPYKISFAERDDKKGFWHFHDGKIKFVPLIVPDMVEIHINSGV